MTKINTSRIDRRKKEKTKSNNTYGTQKHIRIQQEMQQRKKEKHQNSNKKHTGQSQQIQSNVTQNHLLPHEIVHL